MQIGRNTTLDKLGRITLLKEVRDLFMMEEGDTLTYHSENGRVYIEKETTLFQDKYDFEREMIEERVRTYERTMRMLNGSEFEEEGESDEAYLESDTEKADRHDAYEEFVKFIAERERGKKKGKGN